MATAPANTYILPNRAPESNSSARLPDVLAAIEQVRAAAEALAEFEPGLRARVERNRERSERNRHRSGAADGNGHHDDRVVLGRSGLRVECRRCGRTLAVDSTPALAATNGGHR